MFYPIFIVCATLLLTAGLTIFVFPKVLPIFTSVNLNLPVTTKTLIFVSHFLINFGFYLLLFLIATAAAFIFLMKTPKFKMVIERVILKIPLAIFRKIIICPIFAGLWGCFKRG